MIVCCLKLEKLGGVVDEWEYDNAYYVAPSFTHVPLKIEVEIGLNQKRLDIHSCIHTCLRKQILKKQNIENVYYETPSFAHVEIGLNQKMLNIHSCIHVSENRF